MNLKVLQDVVLKGKTILYRSPYDIGVREVNGHLEVRDTSRIEATLDTLNYLISRKCKIVVLTWVGRPGGKVVENLRTIPHARALERLIGRDVRYIDDCVGKKVEREISSLRSGEILMLENVRFYKGEMEDDDSFAKKLTRGSDLVVFDGFPQSHRVSASTTGILRHLPSVAGFYFESEINSLSALLENPKQPFILIIGGAKISDKMGAVYNLSSKASAVLVGGAVANALFKILGKEIGSSLVEDTFTDKGKSLDLEAGHLLLNESAVSQSGQKDFLGDLKRKLHLPSDLTIADSLDNPRETRSVAVGAGTDLVPKSWAVLDIGPKTAHRYSKIISQAKTIFWSGPMGKFEDSRFSFGTESVAKAMELSCGMTVVAGGDTVGAVKEFANIEKFSHISLAGGATLDFLAGIKLPVIQYLEK